MERSRAITALALVWSVGGVIALFAQAIRRLLPRALEALDGLDASGIAAYLGIVVLLGYSEGYKAFHRQFMPRVVARTVALLRRPSTARIVAGPLYAMALTHATRRRLIVSWVITAMVVTLIVGVQQLPMPWRGMIDGGVVLSLAWGVGRLVQLLAVAARGGDVSYPADLPEGEGAS